MRKIIALIILVTIGVSSYAQEANNDLKSKDSDWGVVLNLTGLVENISLSTGKDVNNNNSILVKHHLTDDKVLRLGLGLKSINNKLSREDSISLGSGNRALQVVDSTETRFDWAVSVGFEKHLAGTRRLDPYVGGELVLGRIGSTKIDVATDVTDVTGTGTIRRIVQQDGGFTFGLNVVAGFNYFFAENISIGAEVNLGYGTSTSGGDQSESIVNTPVSGGETSTFSSSKNQLSSRGFNVSSTAGLTLSFYF